MPNPDRVRARHLRRPSALCTLLAFAVVASGCGSGDSSPDEQSTASSLTVCSGGNAACVAGAPTPPRWSDQPNRPAASIEGEARPDPFKPDGGSFEVKVMACDRSLLGKLPASSNAKGADLQNISTNFHLLQSLQILTSFVSKTAATMKGFQSASVDEKQNGKCVCNFDASCQAKKENLTKLPFTEGIDRAACDAFCAAPGATPTDAGVTNSPCGTGGVLAWLPNDIFKKDGKDGFSGPAAAKYALDLIGWLDGMPNFIKNKGLGAALDKFGTQLGNLDDLLATFQCYVDLFTEGYHLGAYSEQRPDLHLCIGWAGHGAYATVGDSSRWNMGARYTSHNLSRTHRAQMRTGGFAVTAFGKTLSLLPGVEFNMQIDGYRWFNRSAPLGISALGTKGGGGIPKGLWKGLDVLSLVDDEQAMSLDTNHNNRLDPQEFLVGAYTPFDYTPEGSTDKARWPRPAAMASYPDEGKSAAVFAAALNLEVKFKPLTKELQDIPLGAFGSIVPYLKLSGGLEWWDTAYRLRKRVQDSINKNLATKLNDGDFDRNLRPFQAPDVTAEAGNKASVKPEIGANLDLGFKVSRWAHLGVQASLGFSVDMQPGGSGGVFDLSRPLAEALMTAAPQGACQPTWTFEKTGSCGNRTKPDSKGTYSCGPADAKASCVVRLGVGATEKLLCIDDWTGINSAVCSTGTLNANGSGGAWRALQAYLDPATLSSIKGIDAALATWQGAKTCADCVKDGTCAGVVMPASIGTISTCEKHGMCCSSSATTVAGQENDFRQIDGIGTAARSNLQFMVSDGGTKIYLTERTSIRRYDLVTGELVTLAGADVQGKRDGVGSEARFYDLQQPALDGQGNLYVADWNAGVRKLEIATGRVTTVGPTLMHMPRALAFVDGSLYIGQTDGAGGSAITRWNLSTGSKTVFVGGTAGYADGVGTAARIGQLLNLEYDGVGALYGSDASYPSIRRIDLATARVTSVAGNGQSGSVDGVGTAAGVDWNGGLAYSRTERALYFADGAVRSNLRRLDVATGAVTTLYRSPDGKRVRWWGLGFASGKLFAANLEGAVLQRIDFGCDSSNPASIAHDKTAAECGAGNFFMPYGCIEQVRSTVSGWEGPGCHPLHTGFPSAGSCLLNRDCASGETCNILAGKCHQDGKRVEVACEPSTAACSPGRTCVDGACVRTCTGTAACGTNEICTAGTCARNGKVAYAEQLAWRLKHANEPQYMISSYSLAEFQLTAALNATAKVRLKLKAFGKEKEFTVWKWSDSFDIGSAGTAKLQPGLSTTYESDSSTAGKVTNYQPAPAFVSRYPGVTPDLDQPRELLAWCAPQLPANVEDPTPPANAELSSAVTNTLQFGIDVAKEVAVTENRCMGGKPMMAYLEDEKTVISTFGSGTCTYSDDASTSFPCSEALVAMTARWGCLDATSARAGLVASRYPNAVDRTRTPNRINVKALMLDPSGDLEAANLNVADGAVNAWLADVQSCFDARFTDSTTCACQSDADCTTGPGQRCDAGRCVDPSGAASQCPILKSAAPKVERCCGDGVRQPGEACDAKETGCTSDCKLASKSSCCLPTGCMAINFVFTESRCRSAGGAVNRGYSCSEVKSCGAVATGSCQTGARCRAPATAAQCVGAGAVFTPGGSCAACSAGAIGASAWYPLDELSGRTATDLAGGATGNYVGSPKPAYSIVKAGLMLNGNGDRVVAPSATGNDVGASDFSLATWIATTKDTGIILGKRSWPTNDYHHPRGYMFGLLGGQILLQMADANQNVNYLSPRIPELTDGLPHHVAVAIVRSSAQGGKLYVDGVERWTFNPTGVPGTLSNVGNLAIGFNEELDPGTTTYPFDGVLDEVQIFRRALSATDVAGVYRAGANRTSCP